MESPIIVHGILTWADFTSVSKIHANQLPRTSLRPLRPLIFVVIVAAIGLLKFMFRDDPGRNIPRPPPQANSNLGVVLSVAAGFAVVLVVAYFEIRRKAKERFQGLTEEQREETWSIDEDGLSVRGVNVEASFRWDAFPKVIESATGFLLYQPANSFRLLPARSFASAEDVARFAAVASGRVKDYVVIGPCRYPGASGPGRP